MVNPHRSASPDEAPSGVATTYDALMTMSGLENERNRLDSAVADAPGLAPPTETGTPTLSPHVLGSPGVDADLATTMMGLGDGGWAPTASIDWAMMEDSPTPASGDSSVTADVAAEVKHVDIRAVAPDIKEAAQTSPGTDTLLLGWGETVGSGHAPTADTVTAQGKIWICHFCGQRHRATKGDILAGVEVCPALRFLLVTWGSTFEFHRNKSTCGKPSPHTMIFRAAPQGRMSPQVVILPNETPLAVWLRFEYHLVSVHRLNTLVGQPTRQLAGMVMQVLGITRSEGQELLTIARTSHSKLYNTGRTDLLQMVATLMFHGYSIAHSDSTRLMNTKATTQVYEPRAKLGKRSHQGRY
ncbi:hypothetical protein CcaverHIS631_0200030 [Cutaneotrichosporon cavernicola]|nr:hypothetical protein CcaverHIS631_0200030 [Cutaneotrichosporon cavernicola]